MITITRQTARRLRTVFRRSLLGIAHRGPIPPLVFRAEGKQLRAQYRYGSLSIEHVESGSYEPVIVISLPLDALAEFEGHRDQPVVIESRAPDRTVVRWDNRGIPQTREYEVSPSDQLEPFPGLPKSWEAASPDLLTALAEATATSTSDSARYALDCVQLRGTVHKVIATDGHQLLIRSAVALPWDGDILIKGSHLFGCKAFPHDQRILIGKTDSHVVLKLGQWTIWSEVQKEARFPKVEEALPSEDLATTRLQLDPDDSRFLEEALDRLPGNEELNSPTTLDMNGKVAIRARGADLSQITELVLDRSSYSGPAIRVNTNRNFLKRAIELGFNEIAMSEVEAPIVCRQEHLIYAWQPLSGDGAIEPTDNLIRITSQPEPVITNSITTNIESPRRIMSAPIQSNGHESAAPANGNGQAASENSGSSLASLIQDAEAVHATLTDARASITRLIAGLRRHRKQSRLVSETLKSLRQLKLTETAE